MASMNLNLEAVSMGGSFSVLDTGMYTVGISGAEIVDTKSGGNMLNLSLTVKNGSSEGKTIINRMNIVNKNPDTVKWALKDLKTIMTVGGHKNPNFLTDSDELMGLTFNVSLEKKGQTKGGEPVCNDQGEQYMENKFMGFFKAVAPIIVPASAKVEIVPTTETKPKGEFPWS